MTKVTVTVVTVVTVTKVTVTVVTVIMVTVVNLADLRKLFVKVHAVAEETVQKPHYVGFTTEIYT